MATPPAPPRVTGDSEQDGARIIRWAWDFYRAVVLEEEFALKSQALASLPEGFDSADLIDPASASVATAQQTANDALLSAANKVPLTSSDAGQFTISETDTSAAVTFVTAQADTDYFVTITASSATGTPASTAFVVIDITKTTTGFTATIQTAPGVGDSVTFDWILAR